MFKPRSSLLAFCVTWAACVPGCSDWTWDQDGPPKRGPTETIRVHPAESAALRGTIGECSWVEGMRRMRVRGYGIVVGLGKNGSVECPRPVRNALLGEMYKRPEFAQVRSERGALTPERMLADPDTSVVLVEGEVPAAAVVGSRFDVTVSALPGTQTTSLRGGRLFSCDLRIFQNISPTASLSGQTLARAAGPVFLNPFSQRPGAATRSAGRIGTILSGAVVTTDRRIRLVMTNPSYSRVRAVSAQINTRFPASKKVADPVSPSFVKLTVPLEYSDDAGHFLDVIRHIHLSRQAGYTAMRTRELAEEIQRPDALYADIALAWESMGRTVLPTVQKLYGHQNQDVRYYAALAGVRLGDTVAVETIAERARDSRNAQRFDAIETLGKAHSFHRAARHLRTLLDDDDAAVRVAAYQALLEHRDSSIDARQIGQDNFVLDLVPSSGDSLIHVQRSGTRRIAVFGDKLRLRTPLFYAHPSGELTLNAYEGDDAVTVVRNGPPPNSNFPPTEANLDLIALIELLGSEPPRRSASKQKGLNADYGMLIHMLHELCDTGTISARLIIEQPSIAELFGPLRPAGRPESELD